MEMGRGLPESLKSGDKVLREVKQLISIATDKERVGSSREQLSVRFLSLMLETTRGFNR